MQINLSLLRLILVSYFGFVLIVCPFLYRLFVDKNTDFLRIIIVLFLLAGLFFVTHLKLRNLEYNVDENV